MRSSLTSEKLRTYFKKARPLGRDAALVSLRNLGGGNHDNFLCRTKSGPVVARVVKPTGIEAGKLDVRREFLLLKLVGKHQVGPKALKLETRKFPRPLLFEEFIDGPMYKDLPAIGPEHLRAACDLMLKVSAIRLTKRRFPALESKATYEIDIRKWHARLDELRRLGGKRLETTVGRLRTLADESAAILMRNRSLLAGVKKRFIYSDIHGANLMWVPAERRAIFIDWQKACWGDPAVMPAYFASAFEGMLSMSTEKSFAWLSAHFGRKFGIKGFGRLFRLRILEREVSNMIWVPWAALKNGEKMPFRSVEEYTRFIRVKSVLKEMRSLRH